MTTPVSLVQEQTTIHNLSNPPTDHPLPTLGAMPSSNGSTSLRRPRHDCRLGQPRWWRVFAPHEVVDAVVLVARVGAVLVGVDELELQRLELGNVVAQATDVLVGRYRTGSMAGHDPLTLGVGLRQHHVIREDLRRFLHDVREEHKVARAPHL